MKQLTPKDLQKLKDRVADDVAIERRITQAIYAGIGGTDLELYIYPSHLYMIGTGHQHFKKYEELDISLIKEPEFKLIDKKLKFQGYTKSIGRHDEFTGIDVYYYGAIPRIYSDEQLETLIQTRTKAELTQLVMPDDYDEHSFHLDCKLMELFKEGTMTMSEVVDRSKGDCSL